MKTVTYNGNRIEVIYQRNGTTILDITKWHIHKGFIFLLSVVNHEVGTSAIWSVHDLSSVQVDLTFSAAKDIFKKSHIKQVLKMVREEIKREPVEFRIKSIEDLTKEKCS
jgi:hypothetical protein